MTAMPSDPGETKISPPSGSVFAAPASPGPGGRRRDESVWQFLERSTEPVAVDTRARWDAWLARMPASAWAALVTRVKDRHNEMVRSVLAELVTFVLLDCVYPDVEIEPETGTGSRADFAVDMPVRTHFEVYRKAPPTAITEGRPAPCRYRRRTREDRVAGLLAERRGPRRGAGPGDAPGPDQGRKVAGILDYDEQVQRRDQEQQARRERAAGEMPGLDASPLERARYLAAHPPSEPPVSRTPGGWSVRISAHPRAADERGPGQFTVGLRSAGEAHIETAEGLEKRSAPSSGSTPACATCSSSCSTSARRSSATARSPPCSTDRSSPRCSTRSPCWAPNGTGQGHLARAAPAAAPAAAVLILRGIWLGCHDATAELWLPPGTISPLLPGPWTVRTIGPDGQPHTVEEASGTAADYLNPSP